MVNNTLTHETELAELVKDYKSYTDKYFLRTKQILEAEGINPYVRYQVFARKGGEVRGVDDAAKFIKGVAGDKARVYALHDGDFYSPGEPLIKIEGNVQDLVDLETVYLGLISSGLTPEIDLNEVRLKAKDIIREAKGKPVFYFGARHFHPDLDERISKICKEEGFIGASTDRGAKAWNSEGMGTTPHALIVSYAAYLKENNLDKNPTVEAAKAFDKYIEKSVPRVMLIDTFNKEIEDTLATARAVPNLKGVRIDTCGENYAQGVEKGNEKNKGVSLAAVWSLREALVKNGFGRLEQTVSSGFNADKTAKFVQADRIFKEIYGYDLFTNIGTGSIANPVMATSDIVAYRNKEGKWEEMHKVGRPERATKRLEEIK